MMMMMMMKMVVMMIMMLVVIIMASSLSFKFCFTVVLSSASQSVCLLFTLTRLK